MRALTYHRFGGLEMMGIEEQPMPIIGPKDVLVAVEATAPNVIDGRVRSGMMGPLVNKRFPKIMGADLAGSVAAVGAEVTTLAVGDRVFGATDPFKGGAMAEYAAVPAAALARVPEGMAIETAAALPIAASAALYAMRELGKVAPGDDVLIYGSSGGVGLFAVQIARALGARVTAVSGPSGLKPSAEAGAGSVIDYRAGPVRFDRRFAVIADFSGRFPFAKARKVLARDGRFIESSPTIPTFIGSMIGNLFRRQKHLMLQTTAKSADLAYLAGLVREGKLSVTIAERFTFDQAIEAYRVQEKGGTTGKIVVTMA